MPHPWVHSAFQVLCAGVRRASRLWAPQGRFPRRILLACNSALSATYLQEFMEVLAGDEDLSFAAVFAGNASEAKNDLAEARLLLKAPEVSLARASRRCWDLVVTADHTHALQALLQPHLQTVLRIPHGLGGKIVDGTDYAYGRRIYDRRGRLRYSAFLEASPARAELAVRLDPQLRGRVKVVGSLRLDHLRAARARKAGSKLSRPVLLLASSWGDGNLFAQWGDALPEFISGWSEKYEVVFRPHPFAFLREPAFSPRLRALLHDPRVRVSRCATPLEEELSRASFVVVDDLSSVALFSVGSGLPTLLVPSGRTGNGGGPELTELARLLPLVRKPDEVEAQREAHFAQWPSPAIEGFVQRLAAHPGEAAHRTRTAVRSLLNLPTA